MSCCRKIAVTWGMCFLMALAGCVSYGVGVSPTAVPPTVSPPATATLRPAPTPRPLTLDDFRVLKIGMTYEEVVALVGEPDEQVAGSTGFATYAYDLDMGETVYLYVYRPSGYLENVRFETKEGERSRLDVEYLAYPGPEPSTLRSLRLEDFENVHVGMRYYEAYMYVGPYDIGYDIEGGPISLIYYLEDGGRVAFNVEPHIAGCIYRIGYSPDSDSGNWDVLAEDTEGVCE